MNLNAIVRSYFQKPALRASEELKWFRKQKSLREAIVTAAWALNQKKKRYRHQSRIRRKALTQAERALLGVMPEISNAHDFDELFDIVGEACRPISGLGSLYIYDTALRISSYRRILPRRVYLHAGTRKGAKALRLDYRKESLSRSELPRIIGRLPAYQIEDILCIYKDRLTGTSDGAADDQLFKRSWCA